MENHENPASSTDIFSGDVGIGLLRRLVLAGVLLATPGCRDEVVFAELSATRAKLEACQAENTNLKVELARMEGDKKDDDDKGVLPILSPPITAPAPNAGASASAPSVSSAEGSSVEPPPVDTPAEMKEKVNKKKSNTPDAGLDEEFRFEAVDPYKH